LHALSVVDDIPFAYIFNDTVLKCATSFTPSVHVSPIESSSQSQTFFVTTQCQSCGFGYGVDNGAVRMPHAEVIEELKCIDCPFGAQCQSGVALPLEGFWSNAQWFANETQASHVYEPKFAHFYLCPPGFCGYTNPSKASQGGREELFPTGCLANRTGVLCSECKRDYTRVSSGDAEHCVLKSDAECSSNHWIVYMLMGVALFAYFVYTYCFRRSTQSGFTRVVIFYANIWLSINILHPIEDRHSGYSSGSADDGLLRRVLSALSALEEHILSALNLRAFSFVHKCPQSAHDALMSAFNEPLVAVVAVIVAIIVAGLVHFALGAKRFFICDKRIANAEKEASYNNEKEALLSSTQLAAVPESAPIAYERHAEEEVEKGRGRVLYHAILTAMAALELVYSSFTVAAFDALHCVQLQSMSGETEWRIFKDATYGRCFTHAHLTLLVLASLVALLPFVFELARWLALRFLRANKLLYWGATLLDSEVDAAADINASDVRESNLERGEEQLEEDEGDTSASSSEVRVLSVQTNQKHQESTPWRTVAALGLVDAIQGPYRFDRSSSSNWQVASMCTAIFFAARLLSLVAGSILRDLIIRSIALTLIIFVLIAIDLLYAPFKHRDVELFYRFSLAVLLVRSLLNFSSTIVLKGEDVILIQFKAPLLFLWLVVAIIVFSRRLLLKAGKKRRKQKHK
jgi:hypothetical protein